MRIGNRFVFRPGIMVTILAVVFVPLFVALGLWQLARADEKARMISEFEALRGDAPIGIDAHTAHPEDLLYRPLQAKGHYLSPRQFMRDNRTYNGIAGYHVLTPLQIEGSESVVLVNRGWVPMGPDRETLPNVRVDEGSRIVTGSADVPDPRTIVLGEEEPEGWPRVIQKIDFQQVSAALGRPVLPVVLRLAEQEPDGFVRHWQVNYGIEPDKHRAYALQWFSFALLALGFYIGLNTRRIGADQTRETEDRG